MRILNWQNWPLAIKLALALAALVLVTGGALLFIQRGRQLEPQAPLALDTLTVAAAAVGGGALLAWVVSRSITDPLRRLTEASRRIAAGDLNQTVVLPGGGEIGALADAFNRMTARLRTTVQSLTEGRDEALAASRLKSQILATVSHDLRTPLGSILSYAEVMREGLYGPVTEKQRETLDRLVTSVEQLLAFVNNLLDSAQMDAGKMDLEISAFPPDELLYAVDSMVNGQASRKGLTLITEKAADVPNPIVGDLARLEQIVGNLVGNAVKFTEQGTVTVRLFCPDEAHWAIEVSDTGPGIPPEAQERIFDAFWQLEGSESRTRDKGSGLGLYIVKQMTHLMDGQVTLHNKGGKGSTFTVTLPIISRED